MSRTSRYHAKNNPEIADRLFERIVTVLEQYYKLKPSMGIDCEILKEALMLVVEKSQIKC